MRKRRLRPRNPEQKEHKLWARVLRAVAAYFRQKMHFISPKGIVHILYEFAQHGIFPGAASRVNHNYTYYETTIVSDGFVCVVFEHVKNHPAFLADPTKSGNQVLFLRRLFSSSRRRFISSHATHPTASQFLE